MRDADSSGRGALSSAAAAAAQREAGGVLPSSGATAGAAQE